MGARYPYALSSGMTGEMEMSWDADVTLYSNSFRDGIQGENCHHPTITRAGND